VRTVARLLPLEIAWLAQLGPLLGNLIEHSALIRGDGSDCVRAIFGGG
jgi:hypothetical protein